jgi:glycosyltransferase involved in cell wall biosynthesis
MADVVYFVIPCFNEEEVLPLTSIKLKEKLQSLIKLGLADKRSRILLVDDGSKDKTWQLIEMLSTQESLFTGVKLSRNKGHQNALLAGLMTAKEYADAVISMDADLQDDINAADGFLKAYYEGCDIVYGVRDNRAKDTFFKRTTAQGFYKFMRIMGVDVIFNHADYRLMSKRALSYLGQYREVNLFLRGIVPLIGLKSTCVRYERGKRAAGVSKYPLNKMLAFAFDGITSFSVKPIRFITMLGGAISIISVVSFVCIILAKILGLTVAGWTSVICSIWFLGGIQLLSIGLVGEYIGKIYSEVKKRPRYFVENFLGVQTKESTI